MTSKIVFEIVLLPPTDFKSSSDNNQRFLTSLSKFLVEIVSKKIVPEDVAWKNFRKKIVKPVCKKPTVYISRRRMYPAIVLASKTSGNDLWPEVYKLGRYHR